MPDYIEKVYSRFNLAPNLPVEIEINEDAIRGRYKTIIHDYNSKTGVGKIALPIYKGAYMRLPVNVEIRIRVYSKISVFLFKSKIIEYGNEGNIKYFIIDIPEIIFKIQRRQFVRVPIVTDGFFYIKKEYEEMEIAPKYSFVSKDFSAGGISFVTKKDLDDGEPLLVNLVLDDELKLENQESAVVRLIGKTDFKDNKYAVKFMDIDSFREKEFVRFVFRHEIEISRKNKR